MKRLDGWLDEKGAPTFSQSDGVLHLTIPGTLKHRQNNLTSTYPIVVEVRASGRPVKIEHLEQSICGGPTATPCQ
jgi:hypothetical protein